MWDILLVMLAAAAFVASAWVYRTMAPGRPPTAWRCVAVVVVIAGSTLLAVILVNPREWHDLVASALIFATIYTWWRIFRGVPTMQERWDDQIAANLSAPHFGAHNREAREIGYRMRHCPQNPRNSSGGSGAERREPDRP